MEQFAQRYRFLKFRRSGACLTVTMDNPPLNAASFDLHEELSHVFYDLADDPCRVVILTGAGRAFSAGGDFQDMLNNCDQPERQARLMARAPHIIHSILALEKPLIARVNGHAMGLGATLALLCDVAIMVDKARIADPHVNVGLSCGDGGALLWPLLTGFARARHHLFTGDALTGAEAAEVGLIHAAVPEGHFDAKVDAYAARLANSAPHAISATKRSINMVLQRLFQGLIEAHIGLEQITMNTADHREALNAFVEKREPRFAGA